MKALVFLANGFEEVEGITQIDFLRRGGVEVVSASIHDDRQVLGAHNIPVIADALLKELSPEDFDMVVLPGGLTGMHNLRDSQTVASWLKSFNEAQKWIAAICASPSVLGLQGLLKDRKCTCYPGFEENLKGGQVVADRVVVDGHIITSKGPGTSIAFALKLIEVLVGSETAKNVGQGAIYGHM